MLRAVEPLTVKLPPSLTVICWVSLWMFSWLGVAYSKTPVAGVHIISSGRCERYSRTASCSSGGISQRRVSQSIIRPAPTEEPEYHPWYKVGVLQHTPTALPRPDANHSHVEHLPKAQHESQTNRGGSSLSSPSGDTI